MTANILIFFNSHQGKIIIKIGDTVGYSGKTGKSAKNLKSNQAHLHFEVRSKGTRSGNRINPLTTISEFKKSINLNPKESDQP